MGTIFEPSQCFFQRNIIPVIVFHIRIEYWNPFLCFHGRASFSKQKTAVKDNCAIPESCPSKIGPSTASQLAWCFWSSKHVRNTAGASLLLLVPEISFSNWYTQRGKIYKEFIIWQKQITKTTENIISRYPLKGLGQKMNILEGL